MNTQFDGEKYIGNDDEPKQYKEASPIDMKIFRAASYNSENVELIRELMEEEAKGFGQYIIDYGWKVVDGDTVVSIAENAPVFAPLEFYQLYQQYKQYK